MSESARTPPVLRSQRVLEPCTMVIFGATGDLTRRKLVPALYNLQLDGRLPEPFDLVCVARREETHESCGEMLRAATEEHSRRPIEPEAWQKLADRISYLMKECGMPNGLSGVGYNDGDVDALTEGAIVQKRLLDLSTVQIDKPLLKDLFRGAMRYW